MTAGAVAGARRLGRRRGRGRQHLVAVARGAERRRHGEGARRRGPDVARGRVRRGARVPAAGDGLARRVPPRAARRPDVPELAGVEHPPAALRGPRHPQHHGPQPVVLAERRRPRPRLVPPGHRLQLPVRRRRRCDLHQVGEGRVRAEARAADRGRGHRRLHRLPRPRRVHRGQRDVGRRARTSSSSAARSSAPTSACASRRRAAAAASSRRSGSATCR